MKRDLAAIRLSGCAVARRGAKVERSTSGSVQRVLARFCAARAILRVLAVEHFSNEMILALRTPPGV